MAPKGNVFPVAKPLTNMRLTIVFRKTVVGDWRLDHLSGSQSQSQVKSVSQMMVFIPLVVVLIGQFCRDVIGRENVKVSVIGQLFFCYFPSVYCLLKSVGFVWGNLWVVCKVLVVVGIGLRVLVVSQCVSFLMSVVVGSLYCKWRIPESPSRFCV